MSNTQHSEPGRRRSRVGAKPLLTSHFDVALVVLAAPIALSLGAPAAGYAIGAAAWVALRIVGAAVDRRASAVTHWSEQVALRLSYRSLRLFLLAAATLLALSVGGKQNGLTALVVIVIAFTFQLPASARSASGRSPSTRPPARRDRVDEQKESHTA